MPPPHAIPQRTLHCTRQELNFRHRADRCPVSRPEDGLWIQAIPIANYIFTTGPAAQATRLWDMNFFDGEHPERGGKITAVVENALSNADPNPASL